MKYNLPPIEFKSIKEMPKNERPREKMQLLGVNNLSDLELLCCILGSGGKDKRVQDLAQEILDILTRNDNISISELKTINGLGDAKAAILGACLELGRRFTFSRKKKYSNPTEIFSLINHYGDRKQEHFLEILLNGALEVISIEVITIGLINKTLVHPREVFSPAIEKRATAIIVAHNHPSGYLKPSPEDLDLTQNLVKAGAILGIRIIDHLIFNSEAFISLAEEGLISCI